MPKVMCIGLIILALRASAQQAGAPDLHSEIAALREEIGILRVALDLRMAELELRDLTRELRETTQLVESLTDDLREARKELAETPASHEELPFLIKAERTTAARLADAESRRSSAATAQIALNRRIEALQNFLRAAGRTTRPAELSAQTLKLLTKSRGSSMRIPVVCLSLFTAAAIHAAPSKGVQAVLMHCWNDSSTGNMIAAVKSSHVTELEISLAAFLDGHCKMPGNPTGDQKDVQRFRNIRRAVRELQSAGIAVRVVVFLGEMHEGDVQSHLADRAKRTWTFLMETDNPTIPSAIMFSPSLEDKYSSGNEFKRALDKIVSGLSEAKVSAYGRLVLRRSPIGHPDTGFTSYRFGSTTLKVRYESHVEPYASQGYNYYSNDGKFVSYNGDTCHNCGSSMTMAAFLNKNYRDVELLWRPAYNLDKRNGTDYDATQASDRADTGVCGGGFNACHFDSREVAALKAFLQ